MLLLLTGLALGPQAIAAEVAPKIVNGAEEAGFPGVIAIGAQLGQTTLAVCTASLITPRVVLSAAHCGADLAPELIVSLGKAFFGADVTDPDELIGFTAFATHPGYVPLENGVTLGENDAAVAILAEDYEGEVIWANLLPIAEEDLGTTMTSVGFGITGGNRQDSGVKRSVELSLDRIDETFLYSLGKAREGEGQICSGDSGGPQMVQEADGRWTQWAIHSWGDAACRQESGSTRVDSVADFVLEQVELAHGTRDLCEANGRYGDGVCDTFCEADPDCIPAALTPMGELLGGGGCSAVPRAPAPARGPLAPLLIGLLLGPALRRRRRLSP